MPSRRKPIVGSAMSCINHMLDKANLEHLPSKRLERLHRLPADVKDAIIFRLTKSLRKVEIKSQGL